MIRTKRRVNEVASLERGIPRVVAVSGGYYTVNEAKRT